MTNKKQWKRLTPSNFPELDKIWRDLYHKLHVEEGMPKTTALAEIGRRHGGLSYQTVARHILPVYKKYQKDYASIQWSIQKKDPVQREKIHAYKIGYQKIRYNIDDSIRASFERYPIAKALTLDFLSELLHEETNVYFRPCVIQGLVKKYEERTNKKLLEERPGKKLMYYQLAQQT